jgi:hypothetical protein
MRGFDLVRRQWVLALASLVASAGCSSSHGSSAGGDGGTGRGDGGGGGGDGGSSDGGGGHPRDGSPVKESGPSRDGMAGSCDAFGHFGVPTSTFTLPVQGSGSSLSLAYDDVQMSFPSVDWTTLDRLYLPAGTYTELNLGNLPARDPAHPLVITNKGGQVFVGNNPMGNYIWSMGGGSGWVLTGRYDPTSQTGDAAFPGHRCGQYANSQGTYGILSDDGFAFSAPYLHMGIAVQTATKFEIEYVEVRRSGFAGIRLLNSRASGDPATPMEDVSVHDVYVHDTGGEGFYFGWTGDPPSNLFPGLQIYNVRILRTGNETLQIQDLGDGTHVYDNVFAGGGLHWLDNGLGLYQDNASQIMTREGTIEIDHNITLDGAATFINFFSEPEPGDAARNVTFHDDYFSDTLDLGFYMGGTAAAGSSFTFDSSFFRGLVYGYQIIQPTGSAPTSIFGVDSTFTAPISLTGNAWEGSLALVNGISGGSGSSGNVSASGNKNGPLTPIAFANPGYPIDQPGHHLTAWAPVATLAPGMPTVTYHTGDVVAYGDNPDFYQCSADTTAGPPPSHPEAWTKLAAPIDDVRVAASSPYASMGVH